MPHRPRILEPSYFHVLNRAVRRVRIFERPVDYMVFLRVLALAQERDAIPLLAYCVMPNHYHLVIGPTITPVLSTFMHRVAVTHAKRWHRARATTGTGPVYQGRFKALRIGSDTHFAAVRRYVEENPVRAGLVDRAQDWPWSSVAADRRNCAVRLSPLPNMQ